MPRTSQTRDDVNTSTPRDSSWSFRRGVFALLGLLAAAAPLVAQTNLKWRADLGLRYFSRNPFISSPSVWRYVQWFADFSLAGHVWDPRFLQFDLGGSFNYTGYGGGTGSPDNNFFGYRLESRFLPRSKFSFGLRFLKNNMGTVQSAAATSALRYAQEEKGFDLSLSRIKYLPSIRLAYLDRAYRSSGSESQTDEREDRVNLDINQAAGTSSFDLSYRRERYENQTIERDRDHENLRATERFQLRDGTSVWFDGILTKNTLALPAGRSFESTYRQFSGNALSRVSKRLQGSVRYAYVDNAVAGRTFSLHTVQASVHYSIRTNLVFSPIFSFSRNEVESAEGSDVVKDVLAGARLTWDGRWKALSWRTHLELGYRRQDNREQGRVQDWSQALGANLSLGNLEALLGSVSYSYSETDADISVPDFRDPLFYYGIGTNLSRHALRIELRSRALRPLDTYLYSRYDTYERMLFGQGPMEATTRNSGLSVGLGRLSVAGDIGADELATGGISALYRTMTSTLDYAFSGSIDLRAQIIQRKRQDVLMGGEFHQNISVFLNFNVARFRASLIYQHVVWEFDGPLRRDEVLSVMMTRSFGMRQ